MYFNESSFNIVEGGNDLLYTGRYVTVDACKDYVADVTRTNHILMVLIVLLGVSILVYINYLRKENKGKPNLISQFKQNFEMLKAQEEQKEREEKQKKEKDQVFKENGR